MKNGKYIAILLACILVVIGVVSIITFSSNSKNTNEILKNEYIQRDMLANIYMSIVSQKEANITLDESALKNIVTGEDFSEETKNYLKLLNKTGYSELSDYTLYTQYNPSTNRLFVTLRSKTYEGVWKYTISFKNGKIEYVADSIRTDHTWLPVPQE